MNLDGIKEYAEREQKNANIFIKEIERLLTVVRGSFDIDVPIELVQEIEAYCDKRGIPAYHVGETCLSISHTYSELLAQNKE